MNVALLFIAAAALLALGVGFLARRGKNMDLEQWTVGGRGFGALFVFLLMAGEIYTTFTFLGGSGFAYGKGAPAYYILCYGTLAYVISYFMLPPIWRYAKENGLYSQSDFFVRKYASSTLGVVVSLVGIVALVPYLVLQLKGLGIIVEIAAYGAISSTLAIWIGAAIVAAYVMVSGVHGSAWTSVAKDAMILVIVVFLGLYLPYHHYGGLGPMFEAIEQAKPGFTALSPHGKSLWWFASTVLLTALGFYMWPHTFGSIYTAKAARVIRKNAIVLALSIDPVVRVLRRVRCHPAGSWTFRTGYRSRAVQALGEDVRSLVCRCHRGDGRAYSVGSRLHDPDDSGDPAGEQSLPRCRCFGR